MRRRDVVILCALWCGFLAALAWALSTQFRWARENKPIQVRQSMEATSATQPASERVTGVIGTVSDDTRDSLAKGIHGEAPEPPAKHPPRAVRKRVAPAPQPQ